MASRLMRALLAATVLATGSAQWGGHAKSSVTASSSSPAAAKQPVPAKTTTKKTTSPAVSSTAKLASAGTATKLRGAVVPVPFFPLSGEKDIFGQLEVMAAKSLEMAHAKDQKAWVDIDPTDRSPSVTVLKPHAAAPAKKKVTPVKVSAATAATLATAAKSAAAAASTTPKSSTKGSWGGHSPKPKSTA